MGFRGTGGKILGKTMNFLFRLDSGDRDFGTGGLGGNIVSRRQGAR